MRLSSLLAYAHVEHEDKRKTVLEDVDYVWRHASAPHVTERGVTLRGAELMSGLS